MLEVICGDAVSELRKLPDESVQCCVTSPPYWGLRDYGENGQLGLERTPEEYVSRLVRVFQEVRRVLRKDGTLWLNLGDSYASGWSCSRRNVIGNGAAPIKSRVNRLSKQNTNLASELSKNPNRQPIVGLKEKDLVGIPWRVAFALQVDGWWLRSDIIWAKPNPMPESVTDRPTKSHEYMFLLTKAGSYYYDAEAIMERANYDGRNDLIMKGSDKYANGFVPNQSPQSIAVTGHQRWKLPNNYKGSLPGRNDGPGQDRRSDNDRQPRKHDDTNHGGNGTGFQNHSGYDQLNHPYVRNKRSVWTVATAPYPEAHFATYPPDLIKPCILAGSRVGDTVLDPFAGSGTTGMVALELGRKAILIELNPKYVELIHQRCDVTVGLPLGA